MTGRKPSQESARPETTDKLGRNPAYHAITGGYIIEELIRVTTGLTIQQYLDRYIRKPMGMQYFRYGLNARDLKKAAVHRSTGLPVTGKFGNAISNVLGLEYEKIVDLCNSADFGRAVLPFGQSVLHRGREHSLLSDVVGQWAL